MQIVHLITEKTLKIILIISFQNGTFYSGNCMLKIKAFRLQFLFSPISSFIYKYHLIISSAHTCIYFTDTCIINFNIVRLHPQLYTVFSLEKMDRRYIILMKIMHICLSFLMRKKNYMHNYAVMNIYMFNYV